MLECVCVIVYYPPHIDPTGSWRQAMPEFVPISVDISPTLKLLHELAPTILLQIPRPSPGNRYLVVYACIKYT